MISHSIAGVVVFESDTGRKIAARYFDSLLRVHAAQAEIERSLIAKAGKSSAVLAAAGVGMTSATTPTLNASSEKGKPSGADNSSSSTVQGSETNEVILVDPYVVLLRLAGDVLIAVIARDSQNDLLMSEYLNTVHGCLSSICGGAIVRKKCYDRLDQVFLIFDESVETGGVIIEFEVAAIMARIGMQNDTPDTSVGSINGSPASTAVREGIAAISRGDANSLRNVMAGAAQTFSSFWQGSSR